MNGWEVVILTILFSAFFSGMEIAFVSSNRLKFELDKGRGMFSARILGSFYKQPSRFIGALLLGNNLALVLYGIAMSKILETPIRDMLPPEIESDFLVMIIQTIIATFIILLTAEFIPKVLFRIRPNAILNFFAVPVKVLYYLIYPLVYIFVNTSEFLLSKIFRLKITQEIYEFTPVDLDNYVKEISEDKVESDFEQEIQMFQNAIDFRNVKLRECMIPRTEVVALEDTDSMTKLKETMIETGHSKILIYKESIDNVIGYTHSYDLFKKPESLKSILREIIIVPETMYANDVFTMMIQQKTSVAVVLDEFGGTSGMITMEYIMEEIFGEIADEYDTDDLAEKRISENEFLFAGRLEIDYLNQEYDLNIPESEEYETLAGYILHFHEDIPEPNEEITIDHFTFRIIMASETKIEQVMMRNRA